MLKTLPAIRATLQHVAVITRRFSLLPPLSSFLPPYETRRPSEISVGIALSGGVGSATSAAILREHGFNLTGLFMVNWSERAEDGDGAHCYESELRDVRALCSASSLSIPLKILSLESAYLGDVDSVLVRSLCALSTGFATPNPDALCAAHIGFDALHRRALDDLGLDYVASGHYAATHWRRTHGDALWEPFLRMSAERRFDQSYFASRMPRRALRRHLFPIGAHFQSKADVRCAARHSAFHVSDRVCGKRSSTGLCYVDGDGAGDDFARFVSRFVAANPGGIVDACGRRLGAHLGLFVFTLGQRLDGGRQQVTLHRVCAELYVRRNRSLFVLDKDVARNELVVASECHAALCNGHVVGEHWNWLQRQGDGDEERALRLWGRFRFRDKDRLFAGHLDFAPRQRRFGHVHIVSFVCLGRLSLVHIVPLQIEMAFVWGEAVIRRLVELEPMLSKQSSTKILLLTHVEMSCACMHGVLGIDLERDCCSDKLLVAVSVLHDVSLFRLCDDIVGKARMQRKDCVLDV